VTLTAGKKFKDNWELGLRFRYLGGAPYTPYSLSASSLKVNWDIRGMGVLDYERLNTERAGALHQLDMRLDKRFFFSKWSLDVYLDIQNVYNHKTAVAPYITVKRDATGQPLEDQNDPSRYQVKMVDNYSGTLLPSIGIIIEL